MRLIYPLLWSRPGREADREQAVNTAAALSRHGMDVTLLLPREPHDPALTPRDICRYFDVVGDLRIVQRPMRHVSPRLVPSMRWLRQVFADAELRAGGVLYTRIPAMFAFGGSSPLPFAIDHYRPWPDDWPWLRPLIRRTARSPRCLGFILHSAFAADSYRRAGIPQAQILVGHNGADPRRLEPRLDKTEARRRLGLPDDRPIVVYSGRLTTQKGLDRLLDVAALRPGVLFLLVGSERRGPIEDAASRLPNVRTLPWQTPDALPAYLYAADVLAIPPSSAPLERFSHCVLPLKVFTYLAAGRPILAPIAKDTAELLRDGDTAHLVPPDDPPRAAAALDRILADTAFAATLSSGARRLAAQLTWDRRAERISAFLRERLGN